MLLLQKVILSVDVVLNLAEKSVGRDLGRAQEVGNGLVETGKILRGLQADLVLVVDGLEEGDLLVGLISAFDHLNVEILVGLMSVDVDIVAHIEL